MNFIERVIASAIRRMGYVKRDNSRRRRRKQPDWLMASGRANQFTVPSGHMFAHQVRLYEKLSWVQTAVSRVAQTAALAKFNVSKIVGERSRDIRNHTFERLLKNPNPSNSRFELLEATFAYYQLTGNAYWFLNRRFEHAPPDEIWLVPSQHIAPIPDEQFYIKGYSYNPYGATSSRQYPLETWQVIHFKRFNPGNMYIGLSPIEALAMVAEGDLKMQKWNTNFFGENNAKPPGGLMFPDFIADAEWDRMKSEIKDQHGGTQRNLMMLRGVGRGGVSWVSMAMSQRDMEFLAARNFNKEEIYSLFAPGLASILDVNATEANAKAGKATFIEFAVWPTMVTVAEKISSDILPVYGKNLDGVFDDIRPADRAMILAEQEAYSRTHTVDEVREKYHNSPPIGDERGKLLIAELGQSTIKDEPIEGVNSEEAPEELKELTVKKAIKTHTSAIIAFFIDDAETINALTEMQRALPAEAELTPPDEFHVTIAYLGDASVLDPAREFIYEQVSRFATSQSGLTGSFSGFGQFNANNKELIPIYVGFNADGFFEFRHCLLQELQDCGIRPENKNFLPHITLGYIRRSEVFIDVPDLSFDINYLSIAWRGEITHFSLLNQPILSALKADIADFSPTEQALYDAILPILERYGVTAVDAIMANDQVDWSILDEELQLKISQELEQVVTSRMLGLAGEAGLALEIAEGTVTTTASRWAKDYSFELIKGLNSTNQEIVQRAISQFQSTPGMTRADVEALLSPHFGEQRAKLITTTENTRANSQAAKTYQEEAQSAGFETERVNKTNNDARVCSVCGPLHNKPESEWPNPSGGPWHTGCRCGTTVRLKRNVNN